MDIDSASTGEPSKSASTSSSPQLVSCFRLESSADYHVTPDYLHSSALVNVNSEDSEKPVSERCRRKTCEWMYGEREVCDLVEPNEKGSKNDSSNEMKNSTHGVSLLLLVNRHLRLLPPQPGGRRRLPILRRSVLHDKVRRPSSHNTEGVSARRPDIPLPRDQDPRRGAERLVRHDRSALEPARVHPRDLRLDLPSLLRRARNQGLRAFNIDLTKLVHQPHRTQRIRGGLPHRAPAASSAG